MTDNRFNDLLNEVPQEVPLESLLTYARLWQFETWLRTMVYVELRAQNGDSWDSYLKSRNSRAYKNDKELSHMPTRENLPTSYMQLGDLLQTMSSQWHLFEPYLPPRQLWDAKLYEVSQIRHRIAHYRRGHEHDLKRVEQLLRDLDSGFWQFCTSYNNDFTMLPQSTDSVIIEFLDLDPFPWNEFQPNQWARLGSADPNLSVSVSFNVLRRHWVKPPTPDDIAGKSGYLYDVTVAARHQRHFEYSRILRNTKVVHSRVCHICLDSSAGTVRVTIPAVLEKGDIVQIIGRFLDAARNALRPGLQHVDLNKLSADTAREGSPWDSIAQEWPEYVLGPSNPLTFLDPDMPCSFFGLE